jgi:hypothetical protein
VLNPPHELTWTGRFLGYNAVDQHLLEPAGDNRTKVTIRESLAGPSSRCCTASPPSRPVTSNGSPP